MRKSQIEETIHSLSRWRNILKIDYREHAKIRAQSGSLSEDQQIAVEDLLNSLEEAAEPRLDSEDLKNIDRLLGIYEHILESYSEASGPAVELDSSLLPTFSLDQSDKDRVLELCSQMRKILFSSSQFDQPHKLRLLNRVAAMEYQVNQESGLLDVFFGAVSDFGETLGKFGTDIKPLTDRLAEVVGIARNKTKEYEQLPPPDEIKKLPKPEH